MVNNGLCILPEFFYTSVFVRVCSNPTSRDYTISTVCPMHLFFHLRMNLGCIKISHIKPLSLFLSTYIAEPQLNQF